MKSTTSIKSTLAVHIRWMIRRDMPEVLQIERLAFDDPWDEATFYRCLRQRNCIGMVAERGERVVGYMVYELTKTQIHLLNFAVAEENRREGVGSQVFAALRKKLSPERRRRITLEVRETNLPAQLFFRELKCRAVSVLHHFYDSTTDDAYRMQYTIHMGAAEH